MGFKDFMYTEKGKITGSVLAAVLISAAVFVPVSIFTDRAIRNDSSDSNSVQVWGYDQQVSSTAEKMNNYMGTTEVLAANIYGGQDVMSSEPVLLQNAAYHSVQDDIEILDGVAQSEEGFGYLASAWIEGYKAKELSPIMIHDASKGAANDTAAYLNPIGDDADKQAIADMGLQATLNMHMKVPVYIANSITIASTGPVITIPGVAGGKDKDKVEAYFDYINSKGYADDFVMQLGFFNYVTTDSSNAAEVETMVLKGTEVADQAEWGQANWDAMETAYDVITGDSTGDDDLANAVKEQQKRTGNYSIKIDGTGTNTGLIKQEVENYEEDLKGTDTWKDQDLKLYYDLTNGGSGEGWKTASGSWQGGEAESDAREDAFLGTQSRFSKKKDSEVLNDFWGYNGDDMGAWYGTDSDEVTYDDPTKKAADGDILGITTGIDLPSFFVSDDMTFDVQLKTLDAAIALSGGETVTANPDPEDKYSTASFTIGKKDYAYGETVTVKVTGMSAEGGRQIYELGASWEQVLNQGLMVGQIVK